MSSQEVIFLVGDAYSATNDQERTKEIQSCCILGNTMSIFSFKKLN